MTKKDIDNIISIICPNDEDYEKPIISPAYLKKELEVLALEQEPMVEIDLDYVIKQKYIEREVLDNIKGYIDYIRNTGMGKKKSLEFIEKFIDGLKAESEE